MTTNFPTSVDSFAVVTTGETILASDVNNVQDPVVAIETYLLAPYDRLNTVAATGSTETADLSVATVHDFTLTANCTLTFTGATTARAYSFTLILRQDATGSRTVTWPASVDWAGAIAPTLSTGVNKVDVFSFLTVDGGTTWLGFVAGMDLR